MIARLNTLLDWFIPVRFRSSVSDVTVVRNFVLLHFLGPLMGQAVTAFLWLNLPVAGWQF